MKYITRKPRSFSDDDDISQAAVNGLPTVYDWEDYEPTGLFDARGDEYCRERDRIGFKVRG